MEGVHYNLFKLSVLLNLYDYIFSRFQLTHTNEKLGGVLI